MMSNYKKLTSYQVNVGSGAKPTALQGPICKGSHPPHSLGSICAGVHSRTGQLGAGEQLQPSPQYSELKPKPSYMHYLLTLSPRSLC